MTFCCTPRNKPRSLLAFLSEQSIDWSRKVSCQWCRLEGTFASQNKQFATGLRDGRAIIWGARDRLCKEQAHAS